MKSKKPIIILAIETSCDDTGIAIVKISPKNGDIRVLSNIVSSQVKIHAKWGGVYPALAKREHQKNLVPVLEQALREARLLKTQNARRKKQNYSAKFKTTEKILEREPKLLKKLLVFLKKYGKPVIDLVTVTNGPGLEPCLWVGVNFARALGYFWDIPIVPINHIEAHILVNFIDKNFQFSWTPSSGLPGGLLFNFQKLFPAVALVVSGGHTQLILMRDFGKYKILGETRDDAAGECFDKTARILGLGYPGGPAISAEAAKFSIFLDAKRTPQRVAFQFSIKLPRPMIHSKDYDFSFSGLKTAVLYAVRKKYSAKALLRSAFSRTTKGRQYIKQMCAEIQQAVIDVLMKKTIKAAKDYNAKTIILGGGVIANEELRKQFAERIAKELPNIQHLTPNTQLCTDNAVMVAITAYFHKTQTRNWQKIKAEANLRIG